MTVAASPTRAAGERPVLLCWLVPTASLLAAAGMATSAVAFLPTAAALIVLAVVVAAAGRRGGPVHLSLEPLGMAFMLVLATLHGPGEPGMVPSHAHATGWLPPALSVAVFALSAGCLASALRHLRARLGRVPRSAVAADLLACVSAAAMCAMAVHMLLR